jgi:hypothetical protein
MTLVVKTALGMLLFPASSILRVTTEPPSSSLGKGRSARKTWLVTIVKVRQRLLREISAFASKGACGSMAR